MSKQNKEKRLKWALKYVNFTEKDWNQVIWNDESRFRLFGSDGRTYVWREPNTRLEEKNLTPTVKFGGGGIMVWGCFAGNTIGNLVVVPETLNTTNYIDLLSKI